MASVENLAPAPGRQPQHQRSRSNVLNFKSFMHRRNNSDGTPLPPADLSTPPYPNGQHLLERDMGFPNFSRPAALGEIQQNQVGGGPRSPSRQEDALGHRSRSPSKTIFASISRNHSPVKGKGRLPQPPQQSSDDIYETSPKKTKSTTNLVGLLSRPKSLKNLHKLVSQEDLAFSKEKENQTPSGLSTSQEHARPPIYAQFSSGALEKQNGSHYTNEAQNGGNFSNGYASNASGGREGKERPKSYHAQYTAKQDNKQTVEAKNESQSRLQRGLRVLTNGTGPKGKPSTEMPDFGLDLKDINKHLEAMLDRRNIPENQRYKMRNLADTIKMEFIRQDWAESQGINNTRPNSNDSDSSMTGRDNDESKAKRTRGRSFTLSRNGGKKSESTSPVKKQRGEGTLGRHFRSRSTESIVSDRPSSSGSNPGTGILSKMKLQQGPLDYVNYLRKVQKPEAVEVGKLHKLRLLLRNETVAWTEEFIRQGGMQEIVGLLHRIMEVEWREEHEDALLHENLLCLKALCTTALALQYLHSIHATLFPAVIHMLFDPEKKGPSDFTTRGIITSVLFTYVQSASPLDRTVRAKTVLGYLRDPEPKDHERPPGFVLDMRRERPYRVWCKEATSVTKEVFWIFLHHLNVVFLPRDKELSGFGPSGIDSLTYMGTHFPQERAPVPAAPYVGGVEWDATNYLASHVDLLNAIIACTPTSEERNSLRGLFRISGWERCMGASLRLCKEKFYPGVHDGLRTWVAAAAEDGWDVRDVRYGPPPEPKSPTKVPNGAGPKRPKKEEEAAPRIEMPKFDLGLDDNASKGGVISAVKSNEDWLA